MFSENCAAAALNKLNATTSETARVQSIGASAAPSKVSGRE
jgi:hypothetical protein